MTFTVDIHHHMLPDFFWQATNAGDHPVGGIAPPSWSRASTLSFLDEAGIDVAVTSISTPGVHTGDDAAARSLARRCNELAAELTGDRPDRFGGFACLPLPDVDGALAELAYALDDLRLDGVVLFSNARGIYLGDPHFTPLFDELQRRAAVVFVHPNPSPDISAHALGLPDSLIDYPADTTRAIARLHYSNTFARTPDVTYILAHAGGTVPYLAGRFGIIDEMHVIPGAENRATAAETFRHLYWDTALSWGDPVLRMLRDVVGIDHVLFGSDYPYLRRDLAVSCRQHIQASPELTASERTAILGGTATKLIPRLAALSPETQHVSLRDRGRTREPMTRSLKPQIWRQAGLPTPTRLTVAVWQDPVRVQQECVIGRCMARTAKRETGLAMKRTVAQRKDRASYSAKREKIVKAAGPVLKRYGLGGTTIEAIAKEAGVDRATIYYYFADKGAIFRDAIHGGLIEMVAALEEVAASGDSPDVRLRNSMRVVMRAFEKHYPQLYIFFTEDSSSVIDQDLNKEIIASGRRYEDLVDETVRDGIRQGIFQTSLPPKVFAKTITGMLNWTSRWFVPDGMLGADDVADGMADTILNGVMVATTER